MRCTPIVLLLAFAVPAAARQEGATAVPATGQEEAAATIVVPDSTNFTLGRYLAYAAPYSLERAAQSKFVRGKDYLDTIEVRPSSFPSGSTLRWRWPDRLSGSGAYGYMQLTFGNYDGGKPEVPVAPIRARDIRRFSQTYQVSLAGAPSGFNVLTEFYLTTRAGVAASKYEEIGFFANLSDDGQRFFDTARLVGTWTDDAGRQWICRSIQAGSAHEYIMFYSGGQVLSGRLDMKSAIDWLASKDEVDLDHYVNGLAIGVEPVRGVGAMAVPHWNVTLD